MVDVIEIDDSDEDVAEKVDNKPFIPVVEQSGNTNRVPNVEPQDVKPQVNGGQNERSQDELLESRHRKIDQLLELYIKYHHRLISVEYLMTPEQLSRWQSHLATSYGSVSSISYQARLANQSQQNSQGQHQQQPTDQPPPQHYDQPSTSSGYQRPAWFIDPSGESGYSSFPAYRRSTTSTTRYKAVRRRRKVRASKPKTTRRTTTARATARATTRTTRRTTTKSASTTATSRTTGRKASSTAASSSTAVSRKPKSTTTSLVNSRPKPSTSKAQVDKKPKVTKLQAMLASVKKER